MRALWAFGSVLSVVPKNMMDTENFEIIIQITTVHCSSLLLLLFFFNVEMYQTESFREWNILLIPEQVMQVSSSTCSGGTSS